MITLGAALISIIFALISLISYLLTKKADSTTTAQNKAVKDQVSSNDAKIQANQNAINTEKAALADKEKNETNDSIISDFNSRK